METLLNQGYYFPEKIQRRATKFISKDYSYDYQSRLYPLPFPPLLYLHELFDVNWVLIEPAVYNSLILQLTLTLLFGLLWKIFIELN